MPRWWQSLVVVRRLVYIMIAVATGCFIVGIVSWPMRIGTLAFVPGTAAILGALLAWFRLDELRELDRLGR